MIHNGQGAMPADQFEGSEEELEILADYIANHGDVEE